MGRRSATKVIGVVGAGQMRAGIAQVAAPAKLRVVPILIIMLSATEEADSTLARVKTTTALSDLHDADLVTEAVSENEHLKRRIFGKLDSVVKPSGILASNTSSIPITNIASCTQRPFRVVGILFMNPPPLMGLVEITRGLQTSDAIFKSVCELAEMLGKTVSCPRVYSGFVENRIWMPIINEAFYALQEGVASAEDNDTGMKLGRNQAMGPLTLADFVGLDICVFSMRIFVLWVW